MAHQGMVYDHGNVKEYGHGHKFFHVDVQLNILTVKHKTSKRNCWSTDTREEQLCCRRERERVVPSRTTCNK